MTARSTSKPKLITLKFKRCCFLDHPDDLTLLLVHPYSWDSAVQGPTYSLAVNALALLTCTITPSPSQQNVDWRVTHLTQLEDPSCRRKFICGLLIWLSVFGLWSGNSSWFANPCEFSFTIFILIFLEWLIRITQSLITGNSSL